MELPPAKIIIPISEANMKITGAMDTANDGVPLGRKNCVMFNVLNYNCFKSGKHHGKVTK